MQASQVEKICQAILTSRDDFPSLYRTVTEFKTDLDSQLKVNFNKWCENSALSVSNGDLM